MTQYELQIARNKKYADRTQTLIQTPKFLMFVVDEAIMYCQEYNDAGKCVSASWHKVKNNSTLCTKKG